MSNNKEGERIGILIDEARKLVEDYINEKRQQTPRLAKGLFLLIRAVLTYFKDKKGLIKEVLNFDLKFRKKKKVLKLV